MKIGSKLTAIVLVLFGLMAFAPLAGAANVLTLVTTHEPPTLDPAEVVSYESGAVTYQVYENLLKYNLETFDIEPSLAEKWEIAPDGKSATFHLRQGVKFHDGTAFNAEAVKYNVERTMAINRAPAKYLEKISKVEVIDDKTIKFYADKAWAFWEDAMAIRKALTIVSPTFVKKNATDKDPWAAKYMYNHTCGTGPYVVSEWVHGQHTKLDKFADYWGGWTDKNFTTVFVKVVREPSVCLLNLKKGTADIAYDIPEAKLAELDKNPEVTVKIVGGMAQMYYPMKCHKGPMKDINVRKAIFYATNLDEIIKARPGAVKAHGAVPRSMIGYDPKLPGHEYNPEKAKELLKKAGYKPGQLTINMVYVAGPEYQRRGAMIIKQNLADVGINLKTQAMPWSTFFPLLADPETAPEIYWFYTAARFADPHGMFWEVFAPGALGKTGFNNGYNNPEVGKLLDQAEVTADREKRAEIYRQVNAILVEDQPAVFAFEMPYSYTYRSNIKGVIPDRLFRTYVYYDLSRD
ncbi:MAG: ABC transporter substrate-binding protein [Deltaproteobacteria bacterium]|nr:ABC transporter substrate-binding protein [Deltaproteobacteria bacterium]